MFCSRLLPYAVPLALVGCGPETPALGEDEVARVNIKEGTPASEFPASCLVDIYDRNNKLVALCSGALIGPSAVLTAGHCVSGFHHFRVYCPYLNRESMGIGEVHPNYRVGPGGSVSPNSDDIGLIYLKMRIPGQYAPLGRKKLPEETLVVNVGRVLDRMVSGKELYRSAPVRVRDGRSVNFPRNYVTVDKIQPGDSGGPTYLYGSSPPEIVAVNSGAGNGFAVLSRMDLVVGWITDRVNLNGGFSLPPGYQPLVPKPPLLVDRP